MNRKEILYIVIGVFLTILAWVVADIYHASTEQKIKDKIEIPQVENYQIDENILKIIEEKKD